MYRTILTGLAMAMLALPLSLRAGEGTPISIDQLTAMSKLVLHGTVVSKSVQRDPENRIYTKIELQVDEVWKGVLTTNRFTIVHGGGILGEQRMEVSGQVEYEVGEEVAVFLLLNQRGQGVSIGMDQGKFHVYTDPSTGEKLAHNPFHGLPQAAPGPGLQANASRPPAEGKARLKLADLKQQVIGGSK